MILIFSFEILKFLQVTFSAHKLVEISWLLVNGCSSLTDLPCRYTNRQSQASPAVLMNFSDQQREQKTNCERIVSHDTTGCNSEASIPSMQRCLMSPATVQSKEFELATPHSHQQHSQQGHSLPIPVKGVRFNDLCAAYGSVLPPVFRTQSGPPSMPSSVVLLEPNFQVNAFYRSNVKENSSEQQRHEPHGPNGNSTPNQIVYAQEHRSERAEDRGLISPANDQSGSSSFCNGNAGHLNSIGHGSNCGSSSNVDQVATIWGAASEGKNEDLTNSGYSHRSIQREAALNKFRLKRKERCYEKKVYPYSLSV